MKDIQEIIEDQHKLSNEQKEREAKEQEKLDTRKWFNKVLAIFQGNLFRNIWNVRVLNEKDLEPAIKKVEKAVREIPQPEIPEPKDYEEAIKKVEEAIKALDLVVNVPKVDIPDHKKELLSIEKAVKDIKIPEVKIPEFPKFDFSPLTKEVKSLKKSLQVSNTENDEKIKKSLNLVLEKLESGLKNLEARLTEIRDREFPVPEDRTREVLDGLNSIKSAIKSLKFPVPTFNAKGIIDAINDITVSINTKTIDEAKYAVYAIYDDGTYLYIGKEDKDGNWLIKRMNQSTGVFEYATGSSDIATNWANRASLSYGLYSSKF